MTGFLNRRKEFRAVELGAFALAAVVVVLALLVSAHLADSLRAAGLNGTPPPNSTAFQGFVDTMTKNAVWIIGTCVVLALVVVGSMFALGHSRAQDYAAKIAMGVALIILAPGIAA